MNIGLWLEGDYEGRMFSNELSFEFFNKYKKIVNIHLKRVSIHLKKVNIHSNY